MSFDVLDEHEQGELVQKWLRENAMAIGVGITLGLVLIFGWKQWQVRQANQGAAAAAQYMALTDAVEAKKTDDASKIAQALRSDFPKSSYAVLAAMQEAEIAVGRNDLAGAASNLDWANGHVGLDSLKYLIGLRLAQVKLAQGDADGALKLTDSIPEGDYASMAAELRGDALLKLGRTDDARKAYALARTGANGNISLGQAKSPLDMKLDELGGEPTAAIATPIVATEKPAS